MKDSTQLLVQKRKLSRTQLFFIYFCIYACVGWIMETLYVSHLKGYLVKRGFLLGPLCPIYGYGALMLIQLFGKYKKQPVKLFFYSIVFFSAFEYIVSFVLEALYRNMWWDYSTHFFNLNGRITLVSSLAWGVLALLLLNVIHPFVEKKIRFLCIKLPFSSQKLIVSILFIVFVVDTILSGALHLFVKINYL